MANKSKQLARRKSRVRRALMARMDGRPRLSVFRSGQHIYAQVIDDSRSRTLASASSIEKDMRAELGSGANVAAASLIGKTIAERCKEVGIDKVTFDRGPYIYHGRVKALAEAAREAGLEF